MSADNGPDDWVSEKQQPVDDWVSERVAAPSEVHHPTTLPPAPEIQSSSDGRDFYDLTTNAMTLGARPQLVGLGEVLERGLNGVSDPNDKGVSDLDVYRKYRDLEKKRMGEVEERNPKMKYVAKVPSLALGGTAKTIGQAAFTAASLAGLGELLGGDADLTKGEFADAAKDAGIKAGIAAVTAGTFGKLFQGSGRTMEKGGEAIESGAKQALWNKMGLPNSEYAKLLEKDVSRPQELAEVLLEPGRLKKFSGREAQLKNVIEQQASEGKNYGGILKDATKELEGKGGVPFSPYDVSGDIKRLAESTEKSSVGASGLINKLKEIGDETAYKLQHYSDGDVLTKLRELRSSVGGRDFQGAGELGQKAQEATYKIYSDYLKKGVEAAGLGDKFSRASKVEEALYAAKNALTHGAPKENASALLDRVTKPILNAVDAAGVGAVKLQQAVGQGAQELGDTISRSPAMSGLSAILGRTMGAGKVRDQEPVETKTSKVKKLLQSNPQALGKHGQSLLNAMKRDEANGTDGKEFSSAYYVLANSNPEFQALLEQLK